MATIQETRNYSLFNLHKLNRTVNRDTKNFHELVKSMERFGFIDAYPLHVVRGAKNALILKGGHHRLAAAIELNIPVKYVVCDDGGASVQEMEAGGPGKWKNVDYFESFCNQGLSDYVAVRDYCKRTGITIISAVSLFGGQVASGSNFTQKLIRGEFLIKNHKLPASVARISGVARDCGFSGYANKMFIAAISKTALTEAVDLERLGSRMKAHKYLLVKYPSVSGYMNMLEEIYNRNSKDRLPLVFLADEARKCRNPKFYPESGKPGVDKQKACRQGKLKS